MTDSFHQAAPLAAEGSQGERSALPDAAPCAEGSAWQSIETAPKDGSHILACRAGSSFGYMDGKQLPPVQTTVHWWGYGKPGFYTSVNELEPQQPFEATHWKPLNAPSDQPPADLVLLWNTLMFFANETSYQGERTGGVLQGCPRGEPPRPDELARWGRTGIAALCRFIGREVDPWMEGRGPRHEAPTPGATTVSPLREGARSDEQDPASGV